MEPALTRSTLARRVLLSGLVGLPLLTNAAHAQRSNRVREGVDRPMVGRNIGMSQFMQLARDVTNQFLSSRQFSEMTGGGRLPRVAVNVRNDSDNWVIVVDEIFTMVQDELTNSGALRIYEVVGPDVEYILAGIFSNTTVPGDRGSEYAYRFRLTLTNVAAGGTSEGGWSSHLTYVQ